MVGLLLEIREVVQLLQLHCFRQSCQVPTGLVPMFEDTVTQLMSEGEAPAVEVLGRFQKEC